MIKYAASEYPKLFRCYQLKEVIDQFVFMYHSSSNTVVGWLNWIFMSNTGKFCSYLPS